MTSVQFTPDEVSKYFNTRVPDLNRGNPLQWRHKTCPACRSATDDFTVNPQTGLSFCFSCGCARDIVSLEQELAGVDFETAKAEVFRLVGRPAEPGGDPATRRAKRKPEGRSTGPSKLDRPAVERREVERLTRAEPNGSFNGFIKLHRSVLNDPIWAQLPDAWLRVFLAILLIANWKPHSWFDGERKVLIPAGSLVTSRDSMCGIARVTSKQYRRAIQYLTKTEFLEQKTTKRYTILTVRNWAVYQVRDGSEVPQPADNKGPSEGQVRATLKEVKKSSSKNEKKKEGLPAFESLSVRGQKQTGEVNDFDDDQPFPEKADSSPEEELIGLIHRATGTAPDQTLLHDISDALMKKGVLIHQYLADIRPRLKRLRSRPKPGFFLHQARTFGQSAADVQERRARRAAAVSAELAAQSGAGIPKDPRCGCQGGRIPGANGTHEYCSCALGRDLKRVERRAERERAAVEVLAASAKATAEATTEAV